MIHVTQFAGVNPARSSWLMSPSQATVAHNAMLRDGALLPFRSPELAATKGYPIHTLYLPADGDRGNAPLITLPYNASITEGPNAGASSNFDLLIVWPHDNSTPPYWIDRYDSTKTYPLVIAAPQKALLATLITSGPVSPTGPDERSWTYTWVDQFGVESLPAPPSFSLMANDGDIYNLTNFDTPPANAVACRVYRTAGLLEDGKQATQNFQTTFQIVREISVPFGGTWLDSYRMIDMSYGTLQSFEMIPPPEMDQVILTDAGYYVGFEGNTLYVSERHEPWHWPDKYRVSFPDQVVAIACSTHVVARYGHMVHGDTVMVGTTGHPYRVGVSWVEGPNHASDCKVDAVPFDERYPCVQQQTMCVVFDGVVYASEFGFVELKAQGPAKILSKHRVSEQDWPLWAPNMVAYLNGRLFATRGPYGHGFVYNMRDQTEGNADLGDLVTIDLVADRLHAGHDGYLYYATGNQVFRWDRGTTPMTYRWKSKEFVSSDRQSLGAAKVMGDYGGPVTFSLFNEGRRVYTRTVNTSGVFRLPSLGKSLRYSFEVSGSTVVREVHIAVDAQGLADRRTEKQEAG